MFFFRKFLFTYAGIGYSDGRNGYPGDDTDGVIMPLYITDGETANQTMASRPQVEEAMPANDIPFRSAQS